MNKIRLYDDQGKSCFTIDATKTIDQGGEGIIVPHPKEKKQVLKIYHSGITPCLTAPSWTYLNKLDARFIKPLELYYHASGEMAGFSMYLLDKTFFRLDRLFNRNLCIRSGINDDIKMKISNELVSVILEAHHKNVVIGDFNQYNIFTNAAGEIRILDVDSFETPVAKHSGRLLDEIRDHYYLGLVNMQSDYFALSVNLFRLLTYVHPYKGIHKTWKSLEERAVKKISVLNSDPDLVIPAFYEPLTDKAIESQFRRIFEDGERFPLQFNQVSFIHKKVVKPVSDNAHITVKLISEDVLDFFFNSNLGYIRTAKDTLVVDCNAKGSPNTGMRISNTYYDDVWIGKKNTIVVKEKDLWFNNNRIKNFEIPQDFRFTQLEHVIFGTDHDNIYHIFPDRIVNGNVYFRKIPAWGHGFRFEETPVQLTGGTFRAHLLYGDNINSIKLPVNPQKLIVHGSIGVISYPEKERIRNSWFITKGLDYIPGAETEEIFSFAVKQVPGNSFIFVPKDGRIEILRTPDFIMVDHIEFEACTGQSQIALTNSGLILREKTSLYVINRK